MKKPVEASATCCSSTVPAGPPTLPWTGVRRRQRLRRPDRGRGPPASIPATEACRPPPPGTPRVFIVGDSQAQIARPVAHRQVTATAGVVDTTLDFQFGSGRAPDFYNWPPGSSGSSGERPDAVVAVFGASDGQGMELDSGVFQPGDQVERHTPAGSAR